MALLIPRRTVTARWQGELQSRLNGRPLEIYLRARGLKFSTDSRSRSADNVAVAALYLVGKGVEAYLAAAPQELCPIQFLTVTQVACSVSEGIAGLIKDPAAWRTAALVSGAQLLKHDLGLGTAARVAAVGAREYARKGGAPRHHRAFCRAAARAVGCNEEAAECALVDDIRRALAAQCAQASPEFRSYWPMIPTGL